MTPAVKNNGGTFHAACRRLPNFSGRRHCALWILFLFLPLFASPALGLEADAPFAGFGTPIDEFTILERGDAYRVTIIYPGIGNRVADADLSLWARGRASSFIKSIEDIAGTVLLPYELHIYYETVKASQTTASIIFTTTITMGEAYPESGLTTFTFDLNDGRRLSYGGIFRNLDGLFDFFAACSRSELLTRLREKGDLRLLESGTTADPANFDLFSLSPTGITLYFPPGQAAPATEGYLRVHIGLEELAPFGPYLKLWGKPENS